MRIQLMTDGSADLSKQMEEELQVKVVPLYLNFGEKQYRTGIDLDIPAFNQMMRAAEELPRSAAPNPNDFYNAYKEVDPETPIIMLSLTKGVSSTYENAEAGKEMLLQEEPERKIEVINTKTASSGLILLLHEAAKKMDEGFSYEQLVQHLHIKVEQTTTLFVLKTIDNLIKGGRLDRMKGTIAKTLNIKLLMKASEEEGVIEVSEKVRGDKKSIRRFIEQIGEYTRNFEDKLIAMTHCNAEERAKKVLEDVKKKYPFKDTILTEMGPLISTYAGEGGLVIAFFKD
ncbi:DegV family EDD domain-containing protein [Sediminibacillus dalangtanensis]|uniref:DegV family EDD domain-containing protein n=1 Tax=Sediminibacillus dalangtanensis TaxID=2729421 RepID=A0ABX7VNF7_9BACI|nr:DegV family protein [Sediminibacillus dalangtanensis]QTM98116.1 DegV family EDD domain-containing protein [Sediminibacillus dalangtanensis]